MSAISAPKRAVIRLAYLAPLITGCLLLIWSFVPHIFFMMNGTAYETLSTAELMSNTWRECRALFEEASASPGAVMFATWMRIAVVAAWVCIVLYAFFCLAGAICSTVAFAYAPTAKEANLAKRWMQFFCPNRPLYVISCLLPLLPSAFPHLLLLCYRTQLVYDMSIHFIGPSDLLLAVLLSALNIGAFLLTLREQDRGHLDLYRLYKSK